ncbi:MAG: hypothetical protein LBT71_07255 [Azoarcus sp.]|nr:hypothetical protein [Azoarcus sp.]
MREIPLTTPGEILALEWLEPLQISQYALAKAIEVPPRRGHLKAGKQTPLIGRTHTNSKT